MKKCITKIFKTEQLFTLVRRLLSLFFNSKLYSLYKQCNDEVHNHNGDKDGKYCLGYSILDPFFPNPGAATPMEEL